MHSGASWSMSVWIRKQLSPSPAASSAVGLESGGPSMDTTERTAPRDAAHITAYPSRAGGSGDGGGVGGDGGSSGESGGRDGCGGGGELSVEMTIVAQGMCMANRE